MSRRKHESAYVVRGLEVLRYDTVVAEWSPAMVEWTTVEGKTTEAETKLIRRAGQVTARQLARLLDQALTVTLVGDGVSYSARPDSPTVRGPPRCWALRPDGSPCGYPLLPGPGPNKRCHRCPQDAEEWPPS